MSDEVRQKESCHGYRILPFHACLQDKFEAKCNKLSLTMDKDEKRFKEHRIPWDNTLYRRAKEACLTTLLHYIRHVPNMMQLPNLALMCSATAKQLMT